MRAWSGAAFPLAVMTTLALLTFWLKQTVEFPEPPPSAALRHDPDSIVEGLRAATFDAQGHPLHYLEADRVVHYPDDDTTHLTQPRVRYTPAGAPEMRATAERGLLLGQNDEVRMLDGVQVNRAASGNAEGWQATMPELTAFPKLGTVRSDTAYVFTQGAARIQGNGFFADQNARKIDLNSKVRGTFPPRPSP